MFALQEVSDPHMIHGELHVNVVWADPAPNDPAVVLVSWLSEDLMANILDCV